jgi:hypothetical protein
MECKLLELLKLAQKYGCECNFQLHHKLLDEVPDEDALVELLKGFG